jgi:hypothetical protein
MRLRLAEFILWPEWHCCALTIQLPHAPYLPNKQSWNDVVTLVECRVRRDYKRGIPGLALKRLLAPNRLHRERRYEDNPIADSLRTATHKT